MNAIDTRAIAAGLIAVDPDPSQSEPPHSQTLAQALAPVMFRHPQAAREVLLAGVQVAYALRRSKRRTIGFSVGADGLVVSAPSWVRLGDIDLAVVGKGDWIVQKLRDARDRGEHRAAQRIAWADGCTLPFLGQHLTVVLDPRQALGGAGAQLEPSTGDDGSEAGEGSGAHHAPVAPMRLRVGLPHTASADQIRDVVQAWLMRQARRIFTERLDHFAPVLGVQWRKLGVSSANTRWGSASADGSIRLNWRLMHFRMPVVDYVVVHELSHLRVMNHSPLFWDTVRAVVPDYAVLRRQLASDTAPQW